MRILPRRLSLAQRIAALSRVGPALKQLDPSVPGTLFTLPAVVLSLSSLVLVALGISRFLYPFDVGHYEAAALAPARILADGQNPYALHHALNSPFVATSYGPVYYGLLSVGMLLGGEGLGFGRACADVSAVLVGLFLLAVSRLIGFERPFAYLAVATLFSTAPLQSWVGMQRPDVYALAFGMAGVWLGLLATKKAGLRASVTTLLAAVSLCCCVLSRQTTVTLCVLAVLLVALRNRQLALLLATSCGMLLALVSVMIDASADGGFFQQLFLMPGSLPRSLRRLLARYLSLAQSPAVWVVGAAALFRVPRIAGYLRMRGPTGAQSMVIDLTFWLSLLLASLTASIPGANVNYFLEPLTIGALLVADLGTYPLAIPRLTVARTIASFALASTILGGIRYGRGEYYRWASLPYYKEVVDGLARHASGRPCFSVYPELAMKAGCSPYLNALSAYGQSPRLARIPDDLFASRAFAAVVWHDPVPPKGYERVRLHLEPPTRFWAVYLHVRRP